MTSEDDMETAVSFDMRAARSKFGVDFDDTRKGRKSREKSAKNSVDRRSMPKSTRTAQFNFKATPELHEKAKAAAARKGLGLGEWMEIVIEAALAAEEGDERA